MHLFQQFSSFAHCPLFSYRLDFPGMQPANFNLLRTQEVVKVTIVKTLFNSEKVASLAVISSVAEPLSSLSDFDTSVESNLACAVQNPCRESNICLWLKPTTDTQDKSDIQHACSNLSVSSAIFWQQDLLGLFSTVLRFGTSRAAAGKYKFTLHIPLRPRGKSGAAQPYRIAIEVDVTARACTSISSVCIENRASPSTCSSSTGMTYTQGDELKVYIKDLRDINGLLVPSRAVDISADMVLTFCMPPAQRSDCNKILMIYKEDKGLFSAALPRLTHKGSYRMLINHGNLTGCLSNMTFVAYCKAGYTANKRLECMPSEEKTTANLNVILGGLVGAVAAACVGLLLFYVRRRPKQAIKACQPSSASPHVMCEKAWIFTCIGMCIHQYTHIDVYPSIHLCIHRSLQRSSNLFFTCLPLLCIAAWSWQLLKSFMREEFKLAMNILFEVCAKYINQCEAHVVTSMSA